MWSILHALSFGKRDGSSKLAKEISVMSLELVAAITLWLSSFSVNEAEPECLLTPPSLYRQVCLGHLYVVDIVGAMDRSLSCCCRVALVRGSPLCLPWCALTLSLGLSLCLPDSPVPLVSPQ